MISSDIHKWVADAVKRENLKSDAAVFVCLSAGPLSKEGGGCYSTFGFQFVCLPLLNGSSCHLFVSSYLNNVYRGAAEKSDILTSLSSAPGGKVQTGDFSAGTRSELNSTVVYIQKRCWSLAHPYLRACKTHVWSNHWKEENSKRTYIRHLTGLHNSSSKSYVMRMTTSRFLIILFLSTKPPEYRLRIELQEKCVLNQFKILK